MKKIRWNRLVEIVMACTLIAAVSTFNACKDDDEVYVYLGMMKY